MEPKLLLIKAITLLFKESLIKDADQRSVALVNDILGTIKLPETGSDFAQEPRERLMALKKTVLWMAESTENAPFDRAALLQRIRLNAGDDESIYMAFEVGIGEEESLEDADKSKAIQRYCISLRSELQEHLDTEKFKKIAADLYRRANSGMSSMIGSREFIRECAANLEGLLKGGRKRIAGIVDEIFFDNEETAEAILARAKDRLSADGAMVFGQQAMNEMCFDNPGALRGEYWCFSALSHHYKSGLGMNIFVDLPLLNKPWMIDPTKKPLIIHISTEDDADKNTLTVYQLLMERETGKPCSTEGLDPKQAALYVKHRLGVNGYHTYLCRVDPSDTTVMDIRHLVEDLEASGYELHAAIIDYPPMLNKAGLSQETVGADLRDMHRRLRNLFSKRKTFCFVFHQLGPKAQEYDRAKVEDFVKEVGGKGLYDGSSKIFQELDVDLTGYIENIGDQGFLTVQCSKHRKPKRTPKHLWYFAMKLSDVGGLQPDVYRDEQFNLVKRDPPNYVRDLKPFRDGAGGGGDWFERAKAGNLF